MNVDNLLANLDSRMRFQDAAAVLDSHMATSPHCRAQWVGSMLVRKIGKLTVVSTANEIIGVSFDGADIYTADGIMDAVIQL